jgi:hypothetical protein
MPTRFKKPLFLRLCLSFALTTALGCSSEPSPTSSRLTTGDIVAVTTEISAQLAASDFLKDRNPDSPEIRLVIDKVINRTSDLIPEAEQWLFVSRVANSLPLHELSNNLNIKLYVRKDKHLLVEQAGYQEPLADAPNPTHLLYAEFISASRIASSSKDQPTDLRSDLYYFEYRITDAQTRQLVWSGKCEFKRQAMGILID